MDSDLFSMFCFVRHIYFYPCSTRLLRMKSNFLAFHAGLLSRHFSHLLVASFHVLPPCAFCPSPSSLPLPFPLSDTKSLASRTISNSSGAPSRTRRSPRVRSTRVSSPSIWMIWSDRCGSVFKIENNIVFHSCFESLFPFFCGSDALIFYRMPHAHIYSHLLTNLNAM